MDEIFNSFFFLGCAGSEDLSCYLVVTFTGSCKDQAVKLRLEAGLPVLVSVFEVESYCLPCCNKSILFQILVGHL